MIRELRERVGGICSNPDCAKRTLGPKSSDKSKSIRRGRAAHIAAAAPGGPRYNAAMSPEQRKSIDNAIWLCTDCADMIDSDPQKYPTSLLKAWKSQTENMASRQLGTPIPNHNDALRAFGILSGQEPFDSPAIISGVHHAYERKLESIDPRFKITIDYVNGSQNYIFMPKAEPVYFDLNYEHGKDIELDEKIKDILIHGGAIDVSGLNISIKGSPVFDYIGGGEFIQKMVIGNSEGVSCQIEIFDKKSNLSSFKALSSGKMYRMPTGFKIEMQMFDGLVSIICKGNLNQENNQDKDKISFFSSISFHLEMWHNKNINELSYFDDSFTFCKLLSEDNTINLNFILHKTNVDFSATARVDSETYKELLLFLEYWRASKIVCEYFKISIPFNLDLKFSDNDLYQLKKYVQIIECGFFEERKKTKKSVCSFTINIIDENIELLKSFHDTCKPIIIKLKQNEHEILEISGNKIKLPLQELVFQNVIPKLNKKIKLAVGKKVTVKFYPAKGYTFQARFMPEM